MSGHSKFANIKHKKEKNDAAKGKIFTIIGREIAVAVKEGGPDPANNFKLATVIAKAKANNMQMCIRDRVREVYCFIRSSSASPSACFILFSHSWIFSSRRSRSALTDNSSS